MTISIEPLAARMRPRKMSEFIGQEHLTGPGKPLHQVIEKGLMHSMVLWGPPGTGKTSLAMLLAQQLNANLVTLSAVTSGIKDIRDVIKQAKELLSTHSQQTILFVDEVHRFNKVQQDAFLPHIESGIITFIGATTENPSFELNNALLSRTRVYLLRQLNTQDLIKILNQALSSPRGLGSQSIEISLDEKNKIISAADGDARQVLTMLEICNDFAIEENDKRIITSEIVSEVLLGRVRRFDKGGDIFYEQISALHKSIRGSSPDAAIYWFRRMIDGGCDPEYIARRLVRAASEDIGNADPRALILALTAWQVYERLGSPEGELALAQTVLYLACASKSNAVYSANNQVKEDIELYGSLEVPWHLRNAPTTLMKKIGYGKEYRYPHDEPEGYAAGENYFPKEMPLKKYYLPVERGLEIQIKEKLVHLKKLDAQKLKQPKS